MTGTDILTTPATLRRAAKRWGDREAVVDTQFGKDVRLTWSELLQEVRTFAAGLAARGFTPGDRVAIWAPNTWHWVVAALGTHWAGGVVVPVNTRYTGAEALDLIQRTKAAVLVVSGTFLGTERLLGLREACGVDDHLAECTDLRQVIRIRLEPADVHRRGESLQTLDWDEIPALCDESVRIEVDAWADAVSPDDVSDILFTSGTTGRSKGVLALHRQSVLGATRWGDGGGLNADDRYLIVNPFFHSFGYKAGFLAAAVHGATIVPLAVYSPTEAMRLVEAERITVFPGAPTIFQTILDAPDRAGFDLSTLRLAVTGAATVPVRLIERMQSELSFDTVLTAYGLSEASGFVSTCVPGDDDVTVATTCGRAYPGMELRLGENDELLVRGDMVMAGYLDDPAATAEAIDEDGWLHTGDVASIDERGYLRITDRLKDMFITGGFNVYPAEIEHTLSRLEGVVESAVIGIADARLGEVGCAFIVRREGSDLTEDEVLDHCRESLANFKVPRQVVFVEGFPRNASGKILKRDLSA